MEEKQNMGFKEMLLYSIKLFFIGGLSLSLIFALFSGGFSSEVFILHVIQNGALCVVLFLGNGMIGEGFSKYYSWIDQPMKRMVITLVAVLVYTVIASFLTLALIYWLYNGISVERFYQFFVRDFLFILILITLIITIFLHGKTFLEAWKNSQIEAEKFKRESIAAQYESLKNQVNPHFLFNSFNVLSSLVHKDANLADKFIKQLSKVYRYILDTREKEVVALSVEMEALEAYVFLSKIRFGNNIDFAINIPDGNEFLVAPLSLQMLVENAIKHNIISKANPLSIKVYLDREEDYIVVENKLQKKNQVQDSSGVGLENIKARYHYISNRIVSFVETTDIFRVKIPLVKMKI